MWTHNKCSGSWSQDGTGSCGVNRSRRGPNTPLLTEVGISWLNQRRHLLFSAHIVLSCQNSLLAPTTAAERLRDTASGAEGGCLDPVPTQTLARHCCVWDGEIYHRKKKKKENVFLAAKYSVELGYKVHGSAIKYMLIFIKKYMVYLGYHLKGFAHIFTRILKPFLSIF